MEKRHPLTWCIAAAITILSNGSIAQGISSTYPSGPVTVVSASPPGGPIEQETRLYLAKMTPLLGKPFILEFKPGAGNVIGINYVAKAAPDGHTLAVQTSTFTVLPATLDDLPFDTIKDFAPISLMSVRTLALIVRSSFPASNLKEYLAYAKANPQKINYGDAGAGTAGHLAGAWLHSATGTKVTFIHYKGSGELSVDLLAGRVDVSQTALTAAMPWIKSGKVRALAITGERTSRLLPGLPTIAQQGVPGYNYTTWLGFLAPAATSPAVVGKLSESFAKVAKSPDIASVLEADGSEMVGGTPEEFRQLIATETATWKRVVKEIGPIQQ